MCSLHFAVGDVFMAGSKRIIKKNRVPTQFSWNGNGGSSTVESIVPKSAAPKQNDVTNEREHVSVEPQSDTMEESLMIDEEHNHEISVLEKNVGI